jgi:acyl-[acyl carrier protein]--UDP-N-acetylglucosamine O-acyltransferase
MIIEGHEGRVRGVNVVGLARGGVAENDQEALKRAYKRIFRGSEPQSSVLEQMRSEAHESVYVERLVAAMSEMEGAVRGRSREGQRDDFMEAGRRRMREMAVPGFED